MGDIIGAWKCECCEFSNPASYEQCSYCGLPRTHTSEQLQQYLRVYQKDKNFGKKPAIAGTFFSIILYPLRQNPRVLFLLILLLLSAIPFVKNYTLIIIPVAAVLGLVLWWYFQFRDK